MLFIIYLLSGAKNINNFSNQIGDFIIFLAIFELIVYISPLIINSRVKKLYYQNTELKNELTEIKNLMLLQNELLRNQQQNYNQYYQQQSHNQNYNNTSNGNSSQY